MKKFAFFSATALILLSFGSANADSDCKSDPIVCIEKGLSALKKVNQLSPPCSTCMPNTEAGKSGPERCELLKGRDGTLNFLQENWNLEAFGFDLFRSLPAVKNASSRKTLGIVDTGAIVEDNPEADAHTKSIDPGLDWDNHGTHVFGSIVSEKYGVNPHLNPVMFPTKNFGGRFDETDLINNLDKAAHDPKISVLSISISFPETEAIAKIIKEAIQSGKWVVWAGGNDGAVNDASAAGQSQFRDSPQFFATGSINYFAAPSYFSNFGSQIELYAPGSDINSLNANYAPGTTGSKGNLNMSGTSMATPQLAGVLQTLKDVDPALSAGQANLLLKATAIERGTNPKIHQINPYLAIQVLTQSKSCESQAPDKYEGCLQNYITNIGQSISEPKEPNSDASCEEWSLYYRKLRENFFSSRGSKASSFALERFFSKAGKNQNWAGRIYFASAENLAGELNMFDQNLTFASSRHELVQAKKFLSGELALKGLDATTKDRRSGLFLLPAELKNVEPFYKECESVLRVKGDKSGGCGSYLDNAPKDFRVAVAKKLLNGSGPIDNIMADLQLSAPEDLQLIKALTAQIAKGLANKPDLAKINYFLSDYAGYLDPKTRDGLIDLAMQRAKAEAPEIQLDSGLQGMPGVVSNRDELIDNYIEGVLIYASPQYLSSHNLNNKLETIFSRRNASNNDCAPEKVKLEYLASRIDKAGDDPTKFLSELEKDLRARKTIQGPGRYLQDDEIVAAAFKNQNVLSATLAQISSPEGLSNFCQVVGMQFGKKAVCDLDAPLLHTILENADASEPALAKKFLQTFVTSKSVTNLFYDRLKGLDHLKVVRDYLATLDKSTLNKRLADEYKGATLTHVLETADPKSAEYNAALAKLGDNEWAISNSSFHNILQNPTLSKQLNQDIKAFMKEASHENSLSGLANRLSQSIQSPRKSYELESYRAVITKLNSADSGLHHTVEAVTNFSTDTSLSFGTNLAESFGQDTKESAAIIDGVAKYFITAEDVPSSKLNEPRESSALRVLLPLANTEVGNRYLKSHTDVVNQMIQVLFSENRYYGLPEKLGPTIISALDDMAKSPAGSQKLMLSVPSNPTSYDRPPAWIFRWISQSEKSFPIALTLLQTNPSDSVKDRTYEAIFNLFKNDPDFARHHLDEIKNHDIKKRIEEELFE